MNVQVLQNALGELNRFLDQARTALAQVEAEVFGFTLNDKSGTFEEPRLALGAILQELHNILVVVLEAAEMPETRASLVGRWREFISAKDGLSKTIDRGQFESCESPAFDYVENIIKGLEISVTGGISSEEAWTLNRLDQMLRETAGLVHQRKVIPENEHHVQAVMHDYLRACFPGFTLNPKINGAIKNFTPDCGIASVGVAIEFKIVHTAKDVAVAFSGVTEDTAGYRGSKDWTRYYAVFYQSRPFMLESHLRYDMKRIGATTWTGIVVNGPTKKKARRAAKGKLTRSKTSAKGRRP